MLCDLSRSAVADELATVLANSSLISAKPSMKKLAVDPVPTPMTVSRCNFGFI